MYIKKKEEVLLNSLFSSHEIILIVWNSQLYLVIINYINTNFKKRESGTSKRVQNKPIHVLIFYRKKKTSRNQKKWE